MQTSPKIKKLLIANRGEIAVRIINTARKMGIETVALTTLAEKNSVHAKLADETIIIGSGPSSSSYLQIEKIIDSALQTNSNYIHPGYGFLSENVDLVEIAEKNNIGFIGPKSDTMKKMGAKDVAKEIMIKNGVKVTPGFYLENQNGEEMLLRSEEINFPIIIKAVNGGGGKGMRVVNNKNEFFEMLESCKAEARNAFGDDRVLIEKYIEDPKHIEVQILGDKFGNVFHFFERDCSIQRRHQKIIEEAPSNLEYEVINKIRETAILAGQSVNYSNAGTVEFLVDKNTNDFYFMEMNTRLQVEHPVSEMITGFDLLELQLRVENGENLKNLQIPKKPLGHSIEARICAEDPFNNFLPSTGKIKYFNFLNKNIKNWDNRKFSNIPEDVKNERLDSGIVEGSNITQYYDSMIGKLIVFGKNRDEALKKLKYQLKNLHIYGVQTNIPFLLNLYGDQDFLNYNYSLKYFENKQNFLLKEKDCFDFENVLCWSFDQIFEQDFDIENRNVLNFRNNSLLKKLLRLRLKRALLPIEGSDLINISISQKELNKPVFDVTIQNGEIEKEFCVELLSKKNGEITLQLSNQIISKKIFNFSKKKFFHKNGAFYECINSSFESIIKNKEDLEISNKIKSPMPGTVTKIFFKENDIVEEGEILLTIEAMKMENKILASRKLKILKINCTVDFYIDMGTIVLETEPVE